MKIKELIAALQKYDPELEVVGGSGDQYCHNIITSDFVYPKECNHGDQVVVVEFSGQMHELARHPLEQKVEGLDTVNPCRACNGVGGEEHDQDCTWMKFCEQDNAKLPEIVDSNCQDCKQFTCICGVGM